MYPPARRQIVIVCLLIVGMVIVGMHRHRSRASIPHQRSLVLTRGASHDAATSANASHGMVVDVAGAVLHPGVYTLQAGARVVDAIARAGGLRSDADIASVNRAARVVDGQQVVVAVRPSVTAAAVSGSGNGSATAAASASGAHSMVSINSADAQAFDTLQGIGPVTAQHIVDDRDQHGPFTTIEDLDRVPGIGAATIEAIRAQVTL